MEMRLIRVERELDVLKQCTRRVVGGLWRKKNLRNCRLAGRGKSSQGKGACQRGCGRMDVKESEK